MEIRTSELTGTALDWAVAKCEGVSIFAVTWCGLPERYKLTYIPKRSKVYIYSPSTNWKQGGPIIEREGIEIRKGNPLFFPKGNERGDYYEPLWLAAKMHGQTQLIAAMRCYVASKLGDEVEIPEELCHA